MPMNPSARMARPMLSVEKRRVPWVLVFCSNAMYGKSMTGNHHKNAPYLPIFFVSLQYEKHSRVSNVVVAVYV